MEKDLPFTGDFTDNKKILKNSMPSKPIRNKVAGYIGRLVKMKKAGPRMRKVIVPTEAEVHPYSEQAQRF